MENTKDKSSITPHRLPRVEVSSHAIDRASERCLSIWLEEGKSKGLGIMSFFIKKSRQAYLQVLALDNKSISIRQCKIDFEGITYCYVTEIGVTRLVTLYMTNETTH